MGAIAFAIQSFNLIKAAVGAGMALKDIYDIITRTNDALARMEAEGRGPSDLEWSQLNAETEKLRSQRPDLTE